jgi:hypothetical protein
VPVVPGGGADDDQELTQRVRVVGLYKLNAVAP